MDGPCAHLPSVAQSHFEGDGEGATPRGARAALRRHFVDLVDRLSRVDYAVNYDGAWGEEFLEQPIVQVFLEAELLYAQRLPTYVRPQNRADQAALAAWLDAQRRKRALTSLALKHGVRTRAG